jgi:polyhydroxybutyrate depolymerase
MFAFLISQVTPAVATTQPLVVGGLRPVTVQLPTDTTKPAPLLIMLHSASTSGAHQERYMKLGPVAKKLGMIYIAPNGTVGSDGRRVWNAAKSCCQRDANKIDDIAYINSLIDEIASKVPVDQTRIYFVGHSNGAFMSIAYACTTGRAAGVVSLAGAMDTDSSCATRHPFTFLQIHGDADPTIKYSGGVHNKFAYTGAEETTSRIASINGCTKPDFTQADLTKKDFDPSIAGAETRVETLSNCAKPTVLWRIAGGLHSPRLPANYAQQILTFLAK